MVGGSVDPVSPLSAEPRPGLHLSLGSLMFLLKVGGHGIASWLHKVSLDLVSSNPQMAGTCLSLVHSYPSKTHRALGGRLGG